MILTTHWSASSPARINDYHVEFALKFPQIDPAFMHDLRAATDPTKVDFDKLFWNFNTWKNFVLTDVTTYGTWHLNHDPRDGTSPDVEIGALCMGGEGTSITRWGRWPYTTAHAWMHAAIIARICAMKRLDPLQRFAPTNGLQDGPIFVVSTHAERAFQTVNPGIDNINHRGYGMYSGDPDMRWDIAVFEQADAGKLIDYPHARQAVHDSAQWLREQSAGIIAHNLLTPTLGLDGPVS